MNRYRLSFLFFDGNSSGVTDMSTLRVARLYDATWVDGGNSSTSGSAGGDGSVVSNALSGFTPSIPVLFALGSSSPAQNPLPLHFQSINASVQFNYVQFRWQMENRTPNGFFIIQQIQGGNWQSYNRSIGMVSGERFYEANVSLLSVNDGYFRILAISQNDTVVSKVLRVSVNAIQGLNLDELFSRGNSQMLELKVRAGSAMNGWCIVADVSGRILRRAEFQLQKGSNLLVMNLGNLPKGVLFVRVVSKHSQSNTMKFVRRLNN